jgi:hypothetical protein
MFDLFPETLPMLDLDSDWIAGAMDLLFKLRGWWAKPLVWTSVAYREGVVSLSSTIALFLS